MPRSTPDDVFAAITGFEKTFNHQKRKTGATSQSGVFEIERVMLGEEFEQITPEMFYNIKISAMVLR